MEKKLYPFVFEPILKDKIWGGNKLKTILNKEKASNSCGESWEISGVEGNLSKISNGFLKGNTIDELIEIYMGDLLGDKIYDQFGTAFPLLIKFIDANDNLSIQVHPDDEVAEKRHQSFGKTEMWYVVDAKENAEMTVGFKNKCDRETYITHLQNKKLLDILNIEKVKKGDAYFIPAGRVHAIGEGILIAEIQQTSDITYRIYDYERLEKGKPRDLHTEQAIDVIDFNTYPTYKSDYNKIENSHNLMVDCNYFTTNYINLTKQIEIDYSEIDSFVIYLCLSGELTITTPYNESIIIKKGMTTLIPAELKNLTLTPSVTSEILEVYIK